MKALQIPSNEAIICSKFNEDSLLLSFLIGAKCEMIRKGKFDVAGHLYMTPNLLCFYGSVFGSKFRVSYSNNLLNTNNFFLVNNDL
jgi:hypothetical protein